MSFLNKRKKFLGGAILSILAFIILVPLAATGATTTAVVEVIGTGAILNANVSAARETAISSSLVSAIESVTAELLPLDSRVRNFKIMDEMFFANTDQFVREYKVLTETVSGNDYRVLVQATIFTEQVKRQLANVGLIQGKKEMPRVLFLVTEKHFDDVLPKYWWGEDLTYVPHTTESAMAEAMKARGFIIINHGRLKEAVNYAIDLNNEEALQLGRLMEADVVVVGSAETALAPNTMGTDIRSFSATVYARAVRTDTGEKIGAVSRSAVTANIDELAGGKEALENASEMVGTDLSLQVAAAWQPYKANTSMIEIVVDGTGYLANFVKFRKMMRNTPGVEGIQIREILPDQATMTVDYQGNARSLADALILNPYDAFGINIYEVSDKVIKLELIPG